MIEIQTTSDENILNFFPPKDFLQGGDIEFVTAKSLRKSPLAEAIFDLGGIEQILLTSDMISITKNKQTDWKNLRPLILAEIMNYVDRKSTNELNNFSRNYELCYFRSTAGSYKRRKNRC